MGELKNWTRGRERGSFRSLLANPLNSPGDFELITFSSLRPTSTIHCKDNTEEEKAIYAVLSSLEEGQDDNEIDT